MSNQNSPFLPPQVTALLRSQRKIEAIKLVLDSNPGLGLRDAKNAVEAYEQRLRQGLPEADAVDVAAAPGPAAPAGFPDGARVAIRSGQKLIAIKIVREAYGLGLREAKDLVEAYAERGDAALAGFTAPADAPGLDLPGEAVALILNGERARAAQLLQSQHGYSAQDAASRVADYSVARHARGAVADSGRTVVQGDRGGALWVVAAIAVALLAVWFFW